MNKILDDSVDPKLSRKFLHFLIENDAYQKIVERMDLGLLEKTGRLRSPVNAIRMAGISYHANRAMRGIPFDVMEELKAKWQQIETDHELTNRINNVSVKFNGLSNIISFQYDDTSGNTTRTININCNDLLSLSNTFSIF